MAAAKACAARWRACTSQAAGPEVKGAKLGFIALTDAAPLFIAKEKGMFAKYGVPDTEVVKQASWGATRDNLVLGSEGNGIDGAHILTPMPYLISAGKVTQNNVPTPMYILARLNLNGQCISVAKEYNDLKIGFGCRPVQGRTREEEGCGQGGEGRHDLPRRHARLVDPLLAGRRGYRPRQGHRDHHGSAAADGGEHEGRHHGLLLRRRAMERAAGPPGHRLHGATTGEIWDKHPEKSLGMRAAWVDKYPNAAQAILMAVMEAQQWCDKPENKPEVAAIVAKRQWFNCPWPTSSTASRATFDYGTGKVVEKSPHMMRFWQDFASYPFKSHDLWFVTEDIRWGKFEPERRCQGAGRQSEPRGSLARGGQGARAAGQRHSRPRPRAARRPSSTARCSIPTTPTAYLKSLAIKRSKSERCAR